MAIKSKDILKREQFEHKRFTYQKGNVSLDFTLRVDIKQDMKDFVEVLKTAQADVEKELSAKK